MKKRLFAIIDEAYLEGEAGLSDSLSQAIEEAEDLERQIIEEGETHPYSLYVVELKAKIRGIAQKATVKTELM